MRWAGHKIWEKRNACKIYAVNRKREEIIRKFQTQAEDNIQMDLGETGWGGMNWTKLVTNGLVFGTRNKASGSLRCWDILGYLCNWRLLKKLSAPWT